jgi:hypothetical protein
MKTHTARPAAIESDGADDKYGFSEQPPAPVLSIPLLLSPLLLRPLLYAYAASKVSSTASGRPTNTRA